MGSGPVPFLQIEISRALYLAEPYFDEGTLEIDDKRVADLNGKIWRALEKVVANL